MHEVTIYLADGCHLCESAQRVLASIQAVDRYERRHHSNVHRGSHTLSAEATAAYEGARATVADHLGAADRRELIFVRNATEAINLVARAWGVTTEELMQQVVQAGADGMTINFPDKLIAYLKSHNYLWE